MSLNGKKTKKNMEKPLKKIRDVEKPSKKVHNIKKSSKAAEVV